MPAELYPDSTYYCDYCGLVYHRWCKDCPEYCDADMLRFNDKCDCQVEHCKCGELAV